MRSTYLVSYVIHNDDAIGTSVIAGGDRPETLLACRIPLYGTRASDSQLANTSDSKSNLQSEALLSCHPIPLYGFSTHTKCHKKSSTDTHLKQHRAWWKWWTYEVNANRADVAVCIRVILNYTHSFDNQYTQQQFRITETSLQRS